MSDWQEEVRDHSLDAVVARLEERLREIAEKREEALRALGYDWDQLREELADDLVSEIAAEVIDDIRSQVRDELEADVEDELRADLEGDGRAELAEEVREELREELRELGSTSARSS